MSLQFKEGDTVRIKDSFWEYWDANHNFWYRQYGFNKKTTFRVLSIGISTVHLKDTNSKYTTRIGADRVELVNPKTKEELVIDKIKYLNKRYADSRTVSA